MGNCSAKQAEADVEELLKSVTSPETLQRAIEILQRMTNFVKLTESQVKSLINLFLIHNTKK